MNSCRDQIQANGIPLIMRGIAIMHPGIIDNDYYNSIQQFYDKMIIDTSAFKVIISHLRRSFDDIHVDCLIKAGETKFDEMENFENDDRTPALLIYLYTTKPTKLIYKELILRNHFQNCIKGKLISEDLNFTPYAAAPTAILLHWPKLKAIHTYVSRYG